VSEPRQLPLTQISWSGTIRIIVQQGSAPPADVYGLETDTTEIGTTEVDVLLANMFSGFAKVQTSDMSGFRLYGLLGVSKAEFRADVVNSDAETTDGDTGLSYGLGVTAGIKPGLTLNGEFVSYLSEDEYSYSGFNFGLSKLF
jgi:hypothetical protein